MLPKFKESDPGLMKIKMGIAAVNKTAMLLKNLAVKYNGTRCLPSTIPITLPHTIFYGPGGCHAKGTEILMFDGSSKRVEDIVVGDLLMGIDSTPRKVLDLVRGVEQLYTITTLNGQAFKVNESHILHLQKRDRKIKSKEVIKNSVDISVKDYLVKSNTFKKYHLLQQTSQIRFPTELENLPIDPYVLGVLLGDGYFGRWSVCITNPDQEIETYLTDWCNTVGLKKSVNKPCKNNKCKTYFFWSHKGMNTNYLINTLKELKLFHTKAATKFIPIQYKTASIQSRLEILAGLLDTDGYLDNKCFEYVSKSKKLAEDVCFIARSLGFRVSFRIKTVKYRGEFRDYYKLCISGHTNLIPIKINRKKAGVRLQIKDHLVYGFTVEANEVGNYYGFRLDNDHLYLTSDFIIHHNCGKSKRAEFAASLLNCSDNQNTFIRLNADCIKSGDELAKILESKLSWNGYLCNKGHLEHTRESGCLNSNGQRICSIIDPINPRGPVKQSIVFIDEIHVLSKSIQEQIGLILLDFRYQYKDKKTEEIKDIYFPKFTCFAATTKLGDLLKPLQTRFGNQIEVPYYTDEEMVDIVKTMASQRGWLLEDAAARIIGLCAQGIAREGENHLRGLYEAACYYRTLVEKGKFTVHENSLSVLTEELALLYIKAAKYLPDGLKYAQIRALNFLLKRGKNKHEGKWNFIGEQAICDNIGVDIENYRINIEPRLIARGLIERGGRGRCITDKGFQYLISVNNLVT